jgi:prefoldin subunit 5
MTIPPKILELIEQLMDELDRIEQQANEGLAISRQLLERFPDNARLIGLSANVGNGLFFVNIFRRRVESIIQKISRTNVSIEAVREAGEELSEIWGRVLECKMLVNRSVGILEDLQ